MMCTDDVYPDITRWCYSLTSLADVYADVYADDVFADVAMLSV